jgi:peptide subunit release factor 1 (eRF1)
VDLGFLADAYRSEGPYATVYLQRRHVGEDAAHQVELRWQSLAQRLTHEGADSATVKALGEALLPRRPGAVSAGQALVAAQGRVLLDRPLRQETPATVPGLTDDEAGWAPLPHLLPLLGYEQQPAPHLVVVADRVGADIHVLADGEDQVTMVDGDTEQIQKVQAGGWSHRRFQQRAENQWEHNASLVATTTGKLATRHRVKLVMLAGDVRARAAIYERLPVSVRAMAVETEYGGRAAGAAEGPLWQEASRRAAELSLREHSTAVERFVADRGESERTAEGLEQVIAALRTGAVDTLLLDPGVHLDPATAQPHVWVGAGSTQLSLTKTELERLGVEEYAADRPDAALIRAAVATGARLELCRDTDPHLADGVAAVLRYPVPA